MITEDRLHHILGVARKAYKVAKAFGADEQFAREMFALGWNHDIGYEFGSHIHGTIGYMTLKSWKYSKYIATHGKADNIILDLIWFIINYSDMTTSPTGEEVTLDERLEEIEGRYGKKHMSYIESKEVCDKLIKYKEDNNLCLTSTLKSKE